MSEYPTRNKLPISTIELNLPPSELNLDNPRSFHNHHLYYYSGRYRRNLIHNSLRDLESSQERLARDQHVLGRLALHNVYTDGVPLPPMGIAMGRLEQGFETGERFKVWSNRDKKYLMHDFTEEIWQRLQDCYNAYKE